MVRLPEPGPERRLIQIATAGSPSLCRYQVVEEDQFEDGRKAYHAYCPALKGCHTWGHTHEEALASIREAVELYVTDLYDTGEPIPLDPETGVLELSTPAVAVNI